MEMGGITRCVWGRRVCVDGRSEDGFAGMYDRATVQAATDSGDRGDSCHAKEPRSRAGGIPYGLASTL